MYIHTEGHCDSFVSRYPSASLMIEHSQKRNLECGYFVSPLVFVVSALSLFLFCLKRTVDPIWPMFMLYQPMNKLLDVLRAGLITRVLWASLGVWISCDIFSRPILTFQNIIKPLQYNNLHFFHLLFIFLYAQSIKLVNTRTNGSYTQSIQIQ